jgi:hypothetical protein
MAQNIIFILTEGDHDSAFIYRILKANGAATDNKIIKEYPFPLNNFFANGVSNVSIVDLNIQDAGSRFLPYRVMQQGDNTFLLYTIGGDSQTEKRVGLSKAINAFNVQDPDAIQVFKDTSIAMLYFFDADDKGVASRLHQVKEEIKVVFTGAQAPEMLTNGEIYVFEDVKVGAFIFTEEGKDTGMLEDVLIPLMRQGNDDIFGAANGFLEIHEKTALFKGKLKMDGANIKKVNGQKYDYRKSLVGTVGQLQKSGKSTTVCISDADYLDSAKILGNDICVSIYQFIQQVFI